MYKVKNPTFVVTDDVFYRGTYFLKKNRERKSWYYSTLGNLTIRLIIK